MHVINTSPLAALHRFILNCSCPFLTVAGISLIFLRLPKSTALLFCPPHVLSANPCPGLVSETELISESPLQRRRAVPSAESAPAEPQAGKDAPHLSPLHPSAPPRTSRHASPGPCPQPEMQQILSASSGPCQRPASSWVALTPLLPLHPHYHFGSLLDLLLTF